MRFWPRSSVGLGHQFVRSHAIDCVLPGAHDEELAKTRVAVVIQYARRAENCFEKTVSRGRQALGVGGGRIEVNVNG